MQTKTLEPTNITSGFLNIHGLILWNPMYYDNGEYY
jgi:hypothetical protein